jgi:hypothetical protein
MFFFSVFSALLVGVGIGLVTWWLTTGRRPGMPAEGAWVGLVLLCFGVLYSANVESLANYGRAEALTDVRQLDPAAGHSEARLGRQERPGPARVDGGSALLLPAVRADAPAPELAPSHADGESRSGA